MMRFAARTGLTSDEPERRYLWTDAFAVCNFLGLARTMGESSYEELALRLVVRVHDELGRHREDDDRRSRWISGLPDEEARSHPTRGGLRIGKPLPERAPHEPPDAELEWERDGQYFHYLTKWMHALDQVARHTGQPWFNVCARELAQVAHRAFVFGPPGARRMAWKLSVDLSRPLVPSMGQHDPLDGFVTYEQLEVTASAFPPAGPRLTTAISEFREMIDRGRLATTDPLGLGGLLVDACRLVQFDASSELVPWLLDVAAVGLRAYMTQPDLRAHANHRLAFRELGLALGIAAIVAQHGALASHVAAAGYGQDRLAELLECAPLADEIEAFWLDPVHRRAATWIEHLDINEVMLATCLAREGFLDLSLPPMQLGANESVTAGR